MGAMIMDFGEKSDGYNMYKIHGTKEQVETAIERIKALGIEIREPYIVERSAPHINSMYAEHMAIIYVWLPKTMANAN